MNINFEWLNDYLDMSVISGQSLAEKMSRTGIEIESVENFSTDIEGLVVGYVKSCVEHPESDHLHICQVEVDNQNIEQIVCGAPNIAEGQKVIVAKVGAKLPNGLEIKATELRGQASNGMICSLQEIGFSDNVIPKEYVKGIFVLDTDAPVGVSIIEYLKLDDPILELDLTPNRSDALSVLGCVHEVAAILNQDPQFKESTFKTEKAGTNLDGLEIIIEDKAISPYFTLRKVENVRVNKSPMWLQLRLMKMGIRPVNNIVDSTNYVMLQFGQPIHAYDLDKIKTNTIGVRYAKNGEHLVTLDDVKRDLDEHDIVITDGDEVIGLAGVMGGLTTEVTDSTRNILIETAMFNSSDIRKTSKKFGLRSEASLRNEKGLDYNTVNIAGDACANLIADLGLGQAKNNFIEFNQLKPSANRITLNYHTIYNKLGINLNKEELVQIFERLKFDVEFNTDNFTVSVPSRRPDISIEADILEEIARIYGYDNIPVTMPSMSGTPGLLTDKQRFTRKISDILEGIGLNQIISYILTSESKANLIHSETYDYVKLSLPMSEERTTLRQSMFPALLEVAQFNFARQAKSMPIYEIGRVFFGQGQAKQPIEQERLAIMLSGLKEEKSWFGQSTDYDFYDLKGMIETLFEGLRLGHMLKFKTTCAIDVLHPGRASEVIFNGDSIGYMGQVHPKVCEDYDLPLNTCFLEINLENLLNYENRPVKQVAMNKYPSSSRDIAMLLPRTVNHATVYATIQEHGGPFLQSINLFDVYQGNNIQEGMQSMAYHLVFQNDQETIKDIEINEAMENIHSALLTIDGLEIR